jgi:hypothetical protein
MALEMRNLGASLERELLRDVNSEEVSFQASRLWQGFFKRSIPDSMIGVIFSALTRGNSAADPLTVLSTPSSRTAER